MKVLLADDDADQLALRCMLLERSGFETIAATDEAQALRTATAELPECAVVDLRFPTEAGGLSLIRALKALDAAMHVVVLTGFNAGHLDHCPEKNLLSGIITKGSGSSASLVQLLKSLSPRAAQVSRESAKRKQR